MNVTQNTHYLNPVHLPRRVFKALAMVAARPKGLKNFMLSTVSMALKSEKNLGMPVHITIEPTNVCDQRCPVCETGAMMLNRPKGVMEYDTFTKIIDRIQHHANIVDFYFMGEPFLNKRAYDMVAYARSKGIYVTTCTDGNFVDGKKAVESDINLLNFQLGGTTQETHQIYRVGGKLDKALKNIKEAVETKRKLPRSNTKIVMGLILMKHNEHQAEDFIKLGEELGVDQVTLVEPWVRNIIQGKMLLPKNKKYWFYDYEAFKKGMLIPKITPNNRCNWIYYATTIMWDGNVVPCCRDPTGKYIMGNVLEQDLKEIWNGEKYREFRRKIATEQKKMDLCSLCSSFPIPRLHKPGPVPNTGSK